jgi:hypothetical protein
VTREVKGVVTPERLGAAFLSLALLGLPSSASLAAPSPPVCEGQRATIRGTAGADSLVGTDRRDVIWAGGGDDSVFGKDGNDLICGGEGSDRLSGEDGVDGVHGGPGHDELDGGRGDDDLHGSSGNDRIHDTGAGDDDTMVGEAGEDFLVEGRYLFGGAGRDILDGEGAGFWPGPGDDVVEATRAGGDGVSYEFSPSAVSLDLRRQDPNDYYVSASGEGTDILGGVEHVIGSPLGDVVSGDDGHNILRGLAGPDVLSGGAGSDRIAGGPGDDRLDGGESQDTMMFDESGVAVDANLISGSAIGEGSDSLVGFEDLIGSWYDDTLTGDDGPNELWGTGGTDSIFAGAGNDFLAAFGEGDAGEGEDECIFINAANCESHFLASAPLPLPWLTTPSVGAVLRRSELDRLAGRVGEGFGFKRPKRVWVGLRLMTPSGCAWLSGGRAMVAGPCGHPTGTRVRVGREKDWSLEIDQPLPAGNYMACVDRKEPRCLGQHGSFGPAWLSFQLTER